jgi:hypothetical protein
MLGRLKVQSENAVSNPSDKPVRRANTEKFAGGRGSTGGQARSEKRSTGRIRTDALRCELGMVSDLSAGGLRIHSKKRPTVQVGETRMITLQVEEQSVQVEALCVWLRVDDACEFDIGMRIDNADGTLRRNLLALAATAQACDGLSRGWSPMFCVREA